MSVPLLTIRSVFRRAAPALAALACAACAAVTAIDLAVNATLPTAASRLHVVRAPADSSDAPLADVGPSHTVALAAP